MAVVEANEGSENSFGQEQCNGEWQMFEADIGSILKLIWPHSRCDRHYIK